MGKKPVHEYLVVSIHMGVITIINAAGNLENYRQRGITKLSGNQFDYAIKVGALRGDIMQYPQLPYSYKIAFESEEISGKANPTFRMPK